MSININFFTVKEVNMYIKNLLQGDSLLANIWVKGEISNFKAHSSGHLYFTLKDESGTLRCVMFRSRAQRLQFQPTHGMEVLSRGYVSVFERDGQYQLYVEEMLPAGAGALHLAYEQLKEKLSKEGLFDQTKKRPLPFLPQSIGIVTSLTGAALKDMLTIIKRRFPGVTVLIVPAIVQGKEGPPSICRALDRVYQEPVDVVIVGRGGGSLEELWCFNTEEVVRKISESPIPIISAVGHETDFTLADLAADCRAATPSMAAELVVPIKDELFFNLNQLQNRLNRSITNYLAQERQRVEFAAYRPIMRDPFRLLTGFQQEMDNLLTRLTQAGKNKIIDEQSRINLLAGKLDALSPLKTMARGYALCFKEDGVLINSVEQVEVGETIKVSLKKGNLTCLVREKEEG